MTSWITSWLPEIPSLNFALPTSSIQQRFISFVLKKSLGHFLKPGQLDAHQIESQIGSGYVHVNDLELDNEAINGLIGGLPIELQGGSLAKVSARIPWPNPLTSTLGLSLDSLHLTFHFRPPSAPQEPPNLADSVVSVAESFIHEELNAREEALLRQSFHQDAPDLDHDLPGGFDPFLSAPEEEEEVHPDNDPAGVSIFASLIERLLARFEFDATNVQISLVLPEHTAFTLTVPEIRYRTEEQAPIEEGAPSGQSRTLTIRGMSVSVRDLQPPPPPLRGPATASGTPTSSLYRRRSPSPASSSSSLDDDTQMMMSQSLAFLPPRPASPASSVASSMYQSAVSTADRDEPPSAEETEFAPELPAGRVPEPAGRAEVEPPAAESPAAPSYNAAEETILSFDSEPICLTLTTPPPTENGPQVLQLSISIGLLSCAIRAWQICGITECAARWASYHPPSPPPAPTTAPASSSKAAASPLFPSIAVQFEMRGVVLLVLPSGPAPLDAFHAKPLVPPSLPHGFLRLHLDTLKASAAIDTKSVSSSLTLSDMSVFSFIPSMTGEQQARPILIVDPNATAQYSSAHIHPQSGAVPELPIFEVPNWPINAGPRVSAWRTKNKNKQAVEGIKVSAIMARASLQLGAKEKQAKNDSNVAVTFAPLSLFVDLDALHLDSITKFVEEMSSSTPSPRPATGEAGYGSDSDGETPPATPKPAPAVSERERERRRLEKMPPLNASVRLPLIRVHVRCPPPPGKQPRSGTLVLDLHDVGLSNRDDAPRATGARFATSTSVTPPLDAFLSAKCRRILVGTTYAQDAKASGFEADEGPPALCPRISFGKAESGRSLLTVDIPSAYIHATKPSVDGLQYLADDVTQFLDRTLGSKDEARTEAGSMIGSDFFAGGSRATSTTDRASSSSSSEFVVKLNMSEAFVRLMVPREESRLESARPFDLKVSDADVLLEVKPEGKDETVITVNLMELAIMNTTSTGAMDSLLNMTSPRSLDKAPRAMLNLRFVSAALPGTGAKESRIKLNLFGFTCNAHPEYQWALDLGRFVKAPPGAFESVPPSERTRVSVQILDGSLRLLGPKHPGAAVVHLGDLEFSTEIVDSPEFSFNLAVPALAFFLLDDLADASENHYQQGGVVHWKAAGYALIAELGDLALTVSTQTVDGLPDAQVMIERIGLRLHLCADTGAAMGAFFQDLAAQFKPPEAEKPPKVRARPSMVGEQTLSKSALAIDEQVYRRVPELGPAPDLIADDLPTNPDYLDESFGAAAGFRELRDDDLEDFDDEGEEIPVYAPTGSQAGVIARAGGETIKMLRPEGINIVENYFDTLPPESQTQSSDLGATTLRVRIREGDITLFLYDGYDWARTRKTIEQEVKEMRKRLAKIRQLVANGQTQETDSDDVSAVLFNSVHIGLDEDFDALEPGALIAAIDEELREDPETASQSSWQSLRAPGPSGKPKQKSVRVHGKRLTRAKGPSIEFRLQGVHADVDQFRPGEDMVSRTFATVRDLEILDHIKTSTWKKFLTELRSDARGNVRETDSNMVRIELRMVQPVKGNSAEEARLRAKILPLRLHVDQDALDFLKHFFSFKDSDAPESTADDDGEGDQTYFQHAEIFPVDLKLDYKPRRVDYRALREGRTIELMNFFHFDGAEMTLRHLTLHGITGWARLGDTLNDLWTPDVKATQLVDVISGVAPIRSMVNVGSGVADLVLLPIAQYKKDGRIVRGVQRGTTAFVKSTAIEAIKLGARLATGTQVILEQAEGVLGGRGVTMGGGGMSDSFVTAEVPAGVSPEDLAGSSSDEDEEHISKYAEQPEGVRAGVQSAYRSLSRNLHSAAQTILAVPMEMYERSGSEGAVRPVIRAVPIAVLKPMIGASEAVSKTLLGLHNTLDPEVRMDNEAKYKSR
ncbi:uncharacterized protein SCHCODRAFT_02483354 [Schizophyllum commune H4-8]|uniref:Autophagy-related protein 2 n=1 Tax=Schizophyllum commune (strain H4-8 / FGSC 9210) TaxID=578458 RepID=D8PTB0_SCHCM|nr:uncharacterized protein SCHCODRAFT_02483354 [Schizophyllum commune H4-8]KAI5899365.1 hypothetical protein SCHCODRAFT_02483354 [Schizophyllum commune H4-8]